MDSALKAEPNLTPLLDMVLQLLMFFMMCVNFVGEQVNPLIQLPRSDSAVPVNRSGKPDNVLFVNLTAEGEELDPDTHEKTGRKTEPRVLIVGRDPFNISQAGLKMRDIARVLDPKVLAQTRVVIRAHRDAKYEHLWYLLRSCNEAGFTNLLIRAEVDPSKLVPLEG